jgi:glycosyltransferase involved in cell wall biosynthesis
VGRFRPRKLLTTIRIVLRLAAKCASRRPRIAYFTLVPVGGAFYRDLLLVGVLKLFRVPLVFHLHGKGVTRAAQFWLNRLLYRWVFASGIVIHLAPNLAMDIAEFVPPERCMLLPNGVLDPGPGTLTRRHRSSRTTARILYLSNMRFAKGPIVLLEALLELGKRRVPFYATFVGASSDMECARQFEQVVRQHRVEGTIRHVGPKYGQEKDELLADADIFVLPSLSECFPLVILEAMSFGLPVVSTVEGGIPEIVLDGVTGTLVPRGDVLALADSLETLIRKPELRNAMGENGRRRYLELFTLERFEQGMCSILQQACGIDPSVNEDQQDDHAESDARSTGRVSLG